MNDLSAAYRNYVRSLAGVPSQGTVLLQIFTPQFATIAAREWRCNKGAMDGPGQQGYRFDDAAVTESWRVDMGPLPPLVSGAWGKEPN
ncbi:hypothetical protein [Bradyrhizobium sp. LTSP885]|uniref:hypothetical protein n=1 Tax=Bradyrhizobium sp. LTSP885 TaxID=1619232 RepID=UPI0018CE7412|nr:hypothetical protein [Bradyrhizobium sp. LTSP885]